MGQEYLKGNMIHSYYSGQIYNILIKVLIVIFVIKTMKFDIIAKY